MELMSFQKNKVKENAALLLDLARRSILHGITESTPLKPSHDGVEVFLLQPQATFVTLEKMGRLRGCIGVLEPIRPLIDDVVYNAFQAAFFDPRFPPLNAAELNQTHISISVLTPPEAMIVDSEEELLERLRPGLDGVILEKGFHRGTFLPAVWEDLPAPKDFIFHLKQKAGLPVMGWDSDIQVKTYESLTFKEPEL